MTMKTSPAVLEAKIHGCHEDIFSHITGKPSNIILRASKKGVNIKTFLEVKH